MFNDCCGEGAGAVVVEWFVYSPGSYLRRGSFGWYVIGMLASALTGPGFHCL